MRKTLGGRMHDTVTSIGYAIGVAALLFILIMLCSEIISRYFFRSPSHWIGDFSGYALLFSTCLLAPYVTREKGHIAVTYVRDGMTEEKRIWLDTAVCILAAAVCLWAGWYAIQETLRQYDRNIQTIAVVAVPRWWMSAGIAYALVSSGIYFVRDAIDGITGRRSINQAQAEHN